MSVQAVRPPRPRKTDCCNQESRLDRTAGVRFWRIGLNVREHTHTHTLAQCAYEPFTWRFTGGNRVDCCCIRRFYDVNVCVHKAAALQLLPLAAAEHKNALLVNLPAKSLLNSFYCLLSTNTLNTISSAHTLQVPFDCELRWSFQTTAMPGTKESY